MEFKSKVAKRGTGHCITIDVKTLRLLGWEPGDELTLSRMADALAIRNDRLDAQHVKAAPQLPPSLGV